MLVTVRNREYDRKSLWFFNVPEFITYEGNEVTPEAWENSKAVLCLSTNISTFPVRVIQRSSIVSINNTPVQQKTYTLNTKTITVTGSKGNTYQVSKVGDTYRCTCPGYQFRKTCRHINELDL